MNETARQWTISESDDAPRVMTAEEARFYAERQEAFAALVAQSDSPRGASICEDCHATAESLRHYTKSLHPTL